jgi:hypothetical protein
MLVAPLPEPKTNGRRAIIFQCVFLNVMFYVTKIGYGWECLPHNWTSTSGDGHG